MENRINIAELLEDCQEGMELDCTIWDNDVKVFLKEVIITESSYPIIVTIKYNNIECTKSFTKYGAFNDLPYSKCVIFPKGKTSWEGFQKPFNDGDIITCTNAWCSFVAIFKKIIRDGESFERYCALILNDNRFKASGCYSDFKNPRLATEEERQKLFQAIKDNGYKWNEETKTLEKLVAPNFKVGNKIIRKGRKGIDYPIEVLAIENGMYKLPAMSMPVDSQDEWELVPDKFDINTLKIFESRVLVRNGKDENWKPAIFGGFKKERNVPYVVVGGIWFKYLIPYEGNEHLLLSKNDCDEFYKTWE